MEPIPQQKEEGPGFFLGFHQEQHRFAAIGGVVERPFPSLPDSNAAVRVEVEENFVLPAVIDQPIADGDPLGIVTG